MEKLIKIAIVTPVYPPYRGGMGSAASQDAEMLRADGGFEVEVFTPKYKDSEKLKAESTKREIAKGVSQLKPFYQWGNAAVLLDLLRVLKGFDIIHLHYPFFGSDIITAFAAKLYKVPLIITCHMRPKASGFLGFTFKVYRLVLERFIFGSARGVLVSSLDYAKAHNINHLQLIDFPFAVDTDRFTPARSYSPPTMVESEGAPESGDLKGGHILFVGGLDNAHYFKGVDVLLRSCAKLTSSWRLTIVGDGDCRFVFEALSKELAIDDRVMFAGSVPFDDLPKIYQSADIHVLPSVDQSEAFGLVTLEAMATGIPSVVSNLPGVRSVIEPEVSGLLVEPGSIESLTIALDRLLADEKLRKKMGEKARKRSEDQYYQAKRTVRLINIYKNVIKAL